MNMAVRLYAWKLRSLIECFLFMCSLCFMIDGVFRSIIVLDVSVLYCLYCLTLYLVNGHSCTPYILHWLAYSLYLISLALFHSHQREPDWVDLPF